MFSSWFCCYFSPFLSQCILLAILAHSAICALPVFLVSDSCLGTSFLLPILLCPLLSARLPSLLSFPVCLSSSRSLSRFSFAMSPTFQRDYLSVGLPPQTPLKGNWQGVERGHAKQDPQLLGFIISFILHL